MLYSFHRRMHRLALSDLFVANTPRRTRSSVVSFLHLVNSRRTCFAAARRASMSTVFRRSDLCFVNHDHEERRHLAVSTSRPYSILSFTSRRTAFLENREGEPEPPPRETAAEFT